VAGWLIEHGADVETKDELGVSVLLRAVDSGELEAVQ